MVGKMARSIFYSLVLLLAWCSNIATAEGKMKHEQGQPSPESDGHRHDRSHDMGFFALGQQLQAECVSSPADTVPKPLSIDSAIQSALKAADTVIRPGDEKYLCIATRSEKRRPLELRALSCNNCSSFILVALKLLGNVQALISDEVAKICIDIFRKFGRGTLCLESSPSSPEYIAKDIPGSYRIPWALVSDEIRKKFIQTLSVRSVEAGGWYCGFTRDQGGVVEMWREKLAIRETIRQKAKKGEKAQYSNNENKPQWTDCTSNCKADKKDAKAE